LELHLGFLGQKQIKKNREFNFNVFLTVTKALPSTFNYKLELPLELINQWIHNRFHVSLLRPHCPNDNALFPNRKKGVTI